MLSGTWVDARFRLKGKTVPLDHGYALFGAIARFAPAIHESRDFGIHAIEGRRLGPGLLGLTDRSFLTMRLPVERVALAMPLVGASLELDGHAVQVGAPQLHPLRPSPLLRSRFVTIKGFHAEPEAFGEALRVQLLALGPWAGKVDYQVGPRRAMRVSTHTIVGFAVALDGLDTDGSAVVQIAGLGGRRHMGAGIFVPPGRGM